MASDDKFKMASDAVKSKTPLVTRFGQIVIGPPGKDGQQGGGGGGSGRIHYFWRGGRDALLPYFGEWDKIKHKGYV